MREFLLPPAEADQTREPPAPEDEELAQAMENLAALRAQQPLRRPATQ